MKPRNLVGMFALFVAFVFAISVNEQRAAGNAQPCIKNFTVNNIKCPIVGGMRSCATFDGDYVGCNASSARQDDAQPGNFGTTVAEGSEVQLDDRGDPSKPCKNVYGCYYVTATKKCLRSNTEFKAEFTKQYEYVTPCYSGGKGPPPE